MTVHIDPSWYTALAWEFDEPYWQELTTFVKHEYSQQVCFPEARYIFRAFDLTPFDRVRVVILGQDPYHTPGAAMGLAFSIPEGIRAQPSLKNIFRELESDMGIRRTDTDLTDWAEQGVFLLNALLSVESGKPESHSDAWWERFTDAAISALSREREGIVFVLWGNFAISKSHLIDPIKHLVITSPHPSPFSAYKGFFGSRPFSRANSYLEREGHPGIKWG